MPMRRAFTMVELMVAVSLLLVVIAATSKIFSTASKVAGIGESNTNVLQETGAIERQIRTDISRIDYDGMIVIQCVTIANNIHLSGDPTAPLLDPSKPAGAIIRADQLLFFAKGTQDSARFEGNQDLGIGNGLARSSVSRILYGHGIQLPDLVPEGPTATLRPDPVGFDFGPLVPWSYDAVNDGPSLDYQYWIGGGGGRTNGTQPEAREWTLARQAVLMADDGGSRALFQQQSPLYGQNSATSLFNQQTFHIALMDGALSPHPDLVNSRVDVTCMNLDDLRRVVAPLGNANWRQRAINGFFGSPAAFGQVGGYVRSEKRAPSMHRLDVMLTAPTLASNCSSFMVDWTWAPYTGRTYTNTPGGLMVFPGFTPSSTMATPWFGFPDSEIPGAQPDAKRGVMTLSEYRDNFVDGGGNPAFVNPPILPEAIEGFPTTLPVPVTQPFGPGVPIKVYTAVFGFNADAAIYLNLAGVPVANQDYTPWPTALRITMTLTDPAKRLEQGRTVQMILELPKRPVS